MDAGYIDVVQAPSMDHRQKLSARFEDGVVRMYIDCYMLSSPRPRRAFDATRDIRTHLAGRGREWRILHAVSRQA